MSQIRFTKYENLIQVFFSCSTNPAFSKGVDIGCPTNQSLMTCNPSDKKTASNALQVESLKQMNSKVKKSQARICSL